MAVTGSLNLAKFPLLNLLGGGQFRKCTLDVLILRPPLTGIGRDSLRHRDCHSGRDRLGHLLDSGGGREGARAGRAQVVSVCFTHRMAVR